MISYKIFPVVCMLGVAAGCSSTQKSKEKVEETKGPSETTFDVSYLDKTVRPQDDFFMFANGTWVRNNPVPPSESRWGSFNELEKSNIKKLTAILENAKTAPKDQADAESMLGNFYVSMSNMTLRNEKGLNGIKADLTAISELKNKADLYKILAMQHKKGITSLFGFGVDQDLKDINRNITYLNQSGIGLPNKEYYAKTDSDILVKYKEYIAKLYQMYDGKAEIAASKAASVLKFETAFAEKMMTPAELRIPEDSYNKMSKQKVKEMLSEFNFEGYLSAIGSQDFNDIIVGQPNYFNNLNKLIKETDLETIKSYLIWANLNHYAAYLTDKEVKANFDFYQGVLTGKTQMKPMNEMAINQITKMSIGEELGKLFVEKYYSAKSQERVNSMVDNLLDAFRERIHTLAWMSDLTKKEALNKLNSIGRKLGFPSKWENFSDLKLDKDDFVGNIDQCSARDFRKNLAKLNQPIDKEKWEMPAHLINAYYHPLLNEIAFPAGIMQAPFFDVDAEDAVNYGRIGMVIGHEFTHGFDDMGSKFAADGSFTNWWTEEDRKLFEERTTLLGNTFAAFCPVKDHCVNPDLTMGENIADLGGITLAYYAYAKTDEFKSGKKIDGYTPAQRFFISFAQLWKINYTEAELKNRVANDPHSPGMYRVNGPLMNCPEFFKAFDVKEGDKMRNADTKVAKIW